MRSKIESIERELINAFNNISTTYDKGRRIWSDPINEVFNIKKEDVHLVLDEGCGTGRLLNTLSLRGYEVVGIDVSWGMLKITKRRVKRNKVYYRSHIIVASMVLKPFRDNIFDISLMIASLHHIPLRNRRIKALKESFRVLKTRGVLLVTVWNLSLPRNMLRAIRWFLTGKLFEFGDSLVPWKKRGLIFQRFYHFYHKRELKRDVLKAGFNLLKSYLWNGGIIGRNVICIAVKE